MGAGYDTRSIRLLQSVGNVRVFEVDAEVTQKAKLGRLREAGIPIPDSTTYLSIDFNRDDPMECLMANGFECEKRCLFILEGLLMYLNDDAVDKTFRLIHDLAGRESRVVFDYVYSSVLRHEGRYYGEELQKNVSDADEPWTFGFEEGKVGDYLLDHGFTIERSAALTYLRRDISLVIMGSSWVTSMEHTASS